MRLTSPDKKVLSLDDLVNLRQQIASSVQRFVLTNGCFDILHRGHIDYLWESSQLGDVLAVAINSDASVRALKGASRPINNEQDRALVVASLGFVDAVMIFPGPRLDAEIRLLRPDVYTKAGDYKVETLDQSERRALEDIGAAIHIVPYSSGYSTSASIQRLATLIDD
jgi:rfaE bifunctional protein nucleotidyltransferase chain/domain